MRKPQIQWPLILICLTAGLAQAQTSAPAQTPLEKIKSTLPKATDSDELTARADAYIALMRLGPQAISAHEELFAILHNADRREEWPWACGVLFYSCDQPALEKIMHEQMAGELHNNVRGDLKMVSDRLGGKTPKIDDQQDPINQAPQICFLHVEKALLSKDEHTLEIGITGIPTMGAIPPDAAKAARSALTRVRNKFSREDIIRTMSEGPLPVQIEFFDDIMSAEEPAIDACVPKLLQDKTRGVPLLIAKMSDLKWLARKEKARARIMEHIRDHKELAAEFMPLMVRLAEKDSDTNVRFYAKEIWCKYVHFHPDPVEAFTEEMSPEALAGIKAVLRDPATPESYRISGSYALVGAGEMPPDVELLFQHPEWQAAWRTLAKDKYPLAHPTMIKLFHALPAPRQAELLPVFESLDFSSGEFWETLVKADKPLCFAGLKATHTQDPTEIKIDAFYDRLTDKDAEIRIAAWTALAASYDPPTTTAASMLRPIRVPNPADETLARAITDADALVRVQVLEVLRIVGNDAENRVVLVLKALRDADPDVRTKACNVLDEFWRTDQSACETSVDRATFKNELAMAYWDTNPSVQAAARLLWSDVYPGALAPADPRDLAKRWLLWGAMAAAALLIVVVGAVICIYLLVADRRKKPAAIPPAF